MPGVFYEHTQRGRMFLITTAAVIALVAVVAALLQRPGGVVASVAVGALVVAVAALFSRLTVTVDADEVRVAFGPGWPRRTVAVADIVDARPVRNHWYHGWGIRKIARGWMFNVWGLDAVELQLASGRLFRIGTDEPAELTAAIAARRPR